RSTERLLERLHRVLEASRIDKIADLFFGQLLMMLAQPCPYDCDDMPLPQIGSILHQLTELHHRHVERVFKLGTRVHVIDERVASAADLERNFTFCSVSHYSPPKPSLTSSRKSGRPVTLMVRSNVI